MHLLHQLPPGATRSPRRRPGRRGMTLVEMLVVIAVVGVLVGLVLPVLSEVSSSGRKTNEMSAGRQLMLAYTNYANVNRDAVLPGVKSGLNAHDAGGRAIADVTIPIAAARYPWRLAPYLDYTFRGLYKNGQERVLEEIENLEDESYSIYFRSLAPSLGLNATWVGGNQDELGFNRSFLDVFGRFYVTRMSEVERPDRLLVFASARGLDPLDDATGVVEGYYEVRSPRLNVVEGMRWPETFDAGDRPRDFGYVSPRYAGAAVVAFMDGHVDTFGQDKLEDMRHWANRAETIDYALEPTGP